MLWYLEAMLLDSALGAPPQLGPQKTSSTLGLLITAPPLSLVLMAGKLPNTTVMYCLFSSGSQWTLRTACDRRCWVRLSDLRLLLTNDDLWLRDFMSGSRNLGFEGKTSICSEPD